MTYISKFRSAGGKVVAVYTCPEHGAFDAEVERDERGEAPDVISCPHVVGSVTVEDVTGAVADAVCGQWSTWTPSASVGCRVRRVEVVRGKWERPERPTYLDTRKLGEGQSMEDFQAERAKVWERKRQQDVMNFKKGF